MIIENDSNREFNIQAIQKLLMKQVNVDSVEDLDEEPYELPSWHHS